MKLEIRVESFGEAGFLATVTNIKSPVLIAQGETPEDAKRKVQKCYDVYLKFEDAARGR